MAARGRKSTDDDIATATSVESGSATTLPRRYKDGETHLATVEPAPVERPYSEAVTDEYKAELKAAGLPV